MFTYKRRVTFYETDGMKVVHHANYLKYFEEARVEYLRAGGLDLNELMEEGIGKLAGVYFVSLFGFIIWVGLFISWLFFHGVKPPTI